MYTTSVLQKDSNKNTLEKITYRITIINQTSNHGKSYQETTRHSMKDLQWSSPITTYQKLTTNLTHNRLKIVSKWKVPSTDTTTDPILQE